MKSRCDLVCMPGETSLQATIAARRQVATRYRGTTPRQFLPRLPGGAARAAARPGGRPRSRTRCRTDPAARRAPAPRELTRSRAQHESARMRSPCYGCTLRGLLPSWTAQGHWGQGHHGVHVIEHAITLLHIRRPNFAQSKYTHEPAVISGPTVRLAYTHMRRNHLGKTLVRHVNLEKVRLLSGHICGVRGRDVGLQPRQPRGIHVEGPDPAGASKQRCRQAMQQQARVPHQHSYLQGSGP